MKSTQGRDLSAHGSLLGANVIFGLNYAVAKGMMPKYIDPFSFILCRVGGAMILFWLFRRWGGNQKVKPKDLALLFVCAAFGVAANQLMFFYGLNLTTPINAAIIMTGNPVLVLLAAAWIIKERITTRKVAGIALGLVGAIGLIVYRGDVDISSDTFRGDAFIFLNACAYAIFLVLVKPLMARYSPVTVMKWVFFFGFFMVLPFGAKPIAQVEWSAFTPAVWAGFAFVVVGTTFLAYLMNTYALKRVSASVVSIYIYVQPVVATAVALALAQDTLTWDKVGAAALIFVGVWLVSARGR